MTDEDRKLLTEFLGECWHMQKPVIFSDGSFKFSPYCSKCGDSIYTTSGEPLYLIYRTFTTPDDMMAVKRKLVEKGEWEGFFAYTVDKNKEWDNCYELVDWLIDETRFCQLDVDYLRRDEKRKE